MAENEIVPTGNLGVKTEGAKVPFFMEHRNALGIPPELKNRPLLYMSSYRGVFDARHEGHKEAFIRILRGEDSRIRDEEKEAVFFDLKNSTQDELLGTLRTFVERTASSVQETNMLPSPGSENMVPPGFVASITYLPALDENYKAIGCDPATFSIDKTNYQKMLQKLKELLIEQKVLQPSNIKPKEDSVKKLP